ncbi:hypothetical protein [Microcoleus sp.]|uniref:hypothetical protein n=1 Tax=Microcoleus sp. TaxID=44472 RepID=UPI003523D0EB
MPFDMLGILIRRKKEEGRRKREEGRGKKEEGRRKKEEGRKPFDPSLTEQIHFLNSSTLRSQNRYTS